MIKAKSADWEGGFQQVGSSEFVSRTERRQSDRRKARPGEASPGRCSKRPHALAATPALALVVAFASAAPAQTAPAQTAPAQTAPAQTTPPGWAPARVPEPAAPPKEQTPAPEWSQGGAGSSVPNVPSRPGTAPLPKGGSPAPSTATIPLLGMEDILGVPGGLTALEAARRAAATSREAERLAAGLTVTDADESRILWGSAPRLSVAAGYTRLSPVTNPSFGSPAPGEPELTFPVLLNNYSLSARLSVPVSDYLFKLGRALGVVGAEREGAQLEVQVAQLRAATEAQLEYYRWVQSKLSTLIAEQALQQAKRRLQDVSRLFVSGRGVNADVLQAQAFAAEAELALQSSRSQELLTERGLRLRMHSTPSDSLTVGEAILDDDGSHIEFSQDATLLYDEALNQRLEIASLVASDRALALAIRTRQGDRLPAIELTGNLLHSNPNQRIFPQQEEFNTTWDVGVQLRWAVNDLGVIAADVAEQEVARAQLRSQLNEIQEQLQLEILTALQQLSEARQNVHTSRQAQQAAEAAYQARSALFQNGRATNLEVLQAETTRFNSHLGLVGAHIAVKMARVRLEHALGRNSSILEGLTSAQDGAQGPAGR